MKKTFRLFFIMLLTVTCSGQSNTELDAILKKIRSVNEVQHRHVGNGGIESENYKNYIALKNTADIKQLVELTSDNNEVVACYSFWALVDKSYSDIPVIFKKFLLDDSKVTTYRGCIKSSDPVSSVIYHKYWNSIPNEQKPSDKTLISLDSMILYYDNPYWLLTTRALENRLYEKIFNSRIEYLAFKKNNWDAITYLTNWYKADYFENIKNALMTYLESTDFKDVGTSEYYQAVDELLKLRDEKVKNRVIKKLKSDGHWKYDKQKFENLLEEYYIYSSDLK